MCWIFYEGKSRQNPNYVFYEAPLMKHLILSGLFIIFMITNACAEEGELTLHLEVNYFSTSPGISDCDRSVKIKNGKNIKNTAKLPCFNQNNKLTLTLEGPKGTQVTLFDRVGYGNDSGYLIIKKNDDRLVWILDLENFPDAKWHSIKANMETGAYDVFYKSAPTFKQNIASIKWGE
jgi:hypothetical protein